MKILSCLIITIGLFQNCFGQNKPHTLLWEISGNGLKQNSFLFGTMHNVNGENFTKKYPVIKEKIISADMLAEENIPGAGETAVDMDILYYRGDTTIQQFLTEKDYETITQFIKKKTGNNPEVLDNLIKMRPQLLVLAMPYLVSDTAASYTEEDVSFDDYLLQFAKDEHKLSTGLENAKERSEAVLNSISDKKAVSMILSEIKRTKQPKPNAPAKGDASIKAYMDLDEHYYLNKTPKDNAGVIRRNAVWLEKLPALMQAQSCFIAVGLDHIRFKVGLIAQLRKMGYKVDPVKM